MNRLQKALRALVGRIDYPYAAVNPTPPFQVIQGSIISTPDNKRNYIDRAYLINDKLYSIVQLVMEKVKLAPWAVYTVKDEAALKQYHAILNRKKITGEDLKKALELRKKALVPYDNDALLSNLLRYPNEMDTFQDLVANSTVYKMLTGDRFIWAELMGAGANKGKPYSLQLLPSQDVSITATRTWPIKVTGYSMKTWGITEEKLTGLSVMHDKYFNPVQDTNGAQLYGMSPLKSALKLMDRSNSENTAATAAFQNMGLKTLIFTDDDRLQPAVAEAQAKAIKEKLTNPEYLGAENANKFAVSGYKMGAIPLGLSPVDLALLDSEKLTLRRLCAVYGVPSPLVGDTEASTYNNVEAAEKALTTRAALPHLNSFRDSFNRKLGTDWGYAGKKIHVDYDISVYTELQEDLGKKWAWVKDLPVPNGYKLDMMGLDHPEDQQDFMNTILIPSGYGTSDDLLSTEVDAALENGDAEIPPNPGGTQMQGGEEDS